MSSKKTIVIVSVVSLAVLIVALKHKDISRWWSQGEANSAQSRLAAFPEDQPLSNAYSKPLGDLHLKEVALAEVPGAPVSPWVQELAALSTPALVERPTQAVARVEAGQDKKLLKAAMEALKRMGRAYEARGLLEAALKQAPDDLELSLLLFDLHRDRLDRELAAEQGHRAFDLALKRASRVAEEAPRRELADKAWRLLGQMEGLAKERKVPANLEGRYDALLTTFKERADLLIRRMEALGEAGDVHGVSTMMMRFGPDHPDARPALLRSLARAHLKAGQEEQAVGVYQVLPDLLTERELLTGLLGLLDEAGKLSRYRRLWEHRLAESFTIDDLVLVLEVYDFQNQSERGERLLRRSLPRIQALSLKAPDLAWLGRITRKAGMAEQAVLFSYNRYLLEEDQGGRTEALLDLAGDLASSRSNPPFPLANLLAPTLRAELADPDPGIASLLVAFSVNAMDVKGSFKELHKADRGYQSLRLAAALATAALKDKEHPRALEIQAGCAKALGLIEAQEQALLRLVRAAPDSRDVPRLYQELAGLAKAAQDDDREMGHLMSALEAAHRLDLPSSYTTIQSQVVNRLMERQRFDEAVNFFWAQVSKRPQDKDLLERFLAFLERRNMVEARINVYLLAIERFPGRDYNDKLATYLLRMKGKEAYYEFVDRLTGTFDPSDLEPFFQNHLNLHSSETAYVEFTERMILKALKRFPDHLAFAERLLRLYERHGFGGKGNEDYQRKFFEVARRYGPLNKRIAQMLMSRLQQTGGLTTMVGQLLALERPNLAEAILTYRALSHLNRHEEALPYLEAVVRVLPGHPDFERELAGLKRSLDFSFFVEDVRLSQEAVKHYLHLHDVDLRETKALVAAGEVEMEGGHGRAGAEIWERMVAEFPGAQERYRELAALYWDYYQFGPAASVLDQARKVMDDDAIFAPEASSLAELQGNMERAISELVKALVAETANPEEIDYDAYDEEGDGPTMRRMRRLAADGHTEAIDRAFAKAIRLAPASPGPVQAYTSYLARQKRPQDQAKVLREAMATIKDRAWLKEARRTFDSLGLRAEAKGALERIIQLGEEEFGDLMELASLIEALGDRDETARVLMRAAGLAEPDPDLMREHLSQVANALARLGKADLCLELLGRREALASSARERKADRLMMASMLFRLDRKEEALAIWRDMLTKDPQDPQPFARLVEHLGREGQVDELIGQYQGAIKAVNKGKMEASRKKARVIQLMGDLKNILVRHERFREALDQTIEIVNRTAIDDAVLDEAHRFGADHGLVERLLEYYRKTALASPKDFRWPTVLGDLLVREGRAEEAVAPYKQALQDDPHRLALYQRLAVSQALAGDASGAAAVTRKAYELTGSLSHLIKAAEYHFLADEGDQATALLQQMAAPDSGVAAGRLVDAAELFWRFGQHQPAQELLERAWAMWQEPHRVNITPGQLEALGQIWLQTKGVGPVMDSIVHLMATIDTALAEAVTQEEYRLESNRTVLRQYLSYNLASQVGNRPEVELREALAARLRAQVDGERESWKWDSRYDIGSRVRSIAQAAERAKLPSVMDYALRAQAEWLAEANPQPTSYSWETRESLNRLARRYWETDRFEGAQAVLGQGPLAGAGGQEGNRDRIFNATVTGDQRALLAAMAQRYCSNPRDESRDPEILTYIDTLASRGPEGINELSAKGCRPLVTLGQLVQRGDKEGALAYLEGAGFKGHTGLWRQAQRARILGRFKDSTPAASQAFHKVLGWPLPLAQAANRQGEVVTGDEWAHLASLYVGLLAEVRPQDSEAGQLIHARAEHAPRSAQAYLDVSDLLLALGRPEEALKALQRARHFAPQSADVTRHFAAYYLSQKKEALALSELESLLGESKPPKADKLQAYVTACQELGLKARAAEAIAENLPGLWSQNRWTGMNLLRLHKSLVDNGPAFIALVERLVKDEGASLETHQALFDSDILESPLKLSLATGATEALVASEATVLSNKVDRLYRLARIAEEAKDPARGEAALVRLAEVDPEQKGRESYLLARVRLAALAGQEDRARELVMSRAGDRPGSVELGEAARLAGQAGMRGLEESLTSEARLRALAEGTAPWSDKLKALVDLARGEKRDRAVALAGAMAGERVDRPESYWELLSAMEEAGLCAEALPLAARAAALLPHRAWPRLRAFACGALIKDEAVAKAALMEMTALAVPVDELGALLGDLASPRFDASALDTALAATEGVEGPAVGLIRASLALARGKGVPVTDDGKARYPSLAWRLAAKAATRAQDKIPALRQALLYDSHNKELLVELAALHIKTGNPSRGLALLHTSLALPCNPASLPGPHAATGSESEIQYALTSHSIPSPLADRLLPLVTKALLTLDRPRQAKLFYGAMPQRVRERDKGALGRKIDQALEKVGPEAPGLAFDSSLLGRG